MFAKKYELIQMSDILRKQQIVLQAARATSNRRSSWQPDEVVKALNHLILVTDHYAKLVAGADSRSAKQAIKLVARSIENDGLYLGPGEHLEFEEPFYVVVSESVAVGRASAESKRRAVKLRTSGGDMAKRKIPMARTANLGKHAQKRAKHADKENVSD
ncbi:hypothetical protein HWV62_34799 [Athelia sp. TMB]|nr:hypothetical protein HWV62_34799 [Athelia sp. TMB]